MSPPSASVGAERDAEQQHREGPDHVHHPRQDRVDPAAVVAAQQADEDGEHRGDDRGDDADEDRRAAAVQQSHHHVAAVLVGAEQVPAVQARARSACRRARRRTSSCPSTHHLVGDVVLRSGPVCATWSAHSGAARHDEHDRDEQHAECRARPCCGAAESTPGTRGCARGSLRRGRRRAAAVSPGASTSPIGALIYFRANAE